MGEKVDDGSRVLVGTADVLLASLGGDERPQLLNVDGGGPLLVAKEVETPHTNLTEVTGMVYSTTLASTTDLFEGLGLVSRKRDLCRLKTHYQDDFCSGMRTLVEVRAVVVLFES